jgi:hypothetical protein
MRICFEDSSYNVTSHWDNPSKQGSRISELEPAMPAIRLFIAGDDVGGSQTSAFVSESEMITRADPLLEMCHIINLTGHVGNGL